MSFVKKTLAISNKHLSKSTIDAMREVGETKTADKNDFIISINDKPFLNSCNMGDLNAIIFFAQCMECDIIHIHDDGECVPFLMKYIHHSREVDGNPAILELAYYGNVLVYQKLV